ncbi:glycosyl hydrolase family 8 [Falsiroseomonas selenitidurans]|uniref:cellulase n=1 Tax=Falsiroseomonas selenitidurans TaxID=2716335 RepID=A0ABX1E8H4_9PROT|nr:glycosyl hydrolase family 8 [Falsiroseomonas selenitidurans]NKC33341.1 glycosyl hydrolase family 5 [Falsiroseomonas selenitidurans]
MPPHLRRRSLLVLSAPALVAGPAVPLRAGRLPQDAPLDTQQWRSFCARYLLPEGRVVDPANGSISHSEGQGWALLCAEQALDRETFDQVLGWTRRVLGRPGDALLSWRYRPDGMGGGAVDDPNNATDGDLMVAWALLRAGHRWRSAAYVEQGVAIARDVLRLLVRQVAEETVLLPGATGFEQREHVVVNPSYYAFPAFRALAQAVPDPLWLRLAADGLNLLRRARFGRWALPADWVALPRTGGRPVPAPGWPARFSYDAVRVPLYLAWAGMGREPAAASAVRFWSDPRHGRLPAWTDLGSDAISPYEASPGIRAIAQLARSRHGEAAPMPEWPSLDETGDYYSSVLTLLVRLAWRDSLTASI